MNLADSFTTINIFQPDELFHHFRQNERGVELSFAARYINDFPDLVEVGAVTPYYLKINHPVVDPYDSYEGCIKLDAESVDLRGKNVLCLSTVEHMGNADYGNKDLDESKPIRFLEKLESETNSFLVTWPIGARPILDEYIFGGTKHNVVVLHRVSNEYPIWRVESDVNVLRRIKYNDPFPNANGLIIVTKGL